MSPIMSVYESNQFNCFKISMPQTVPHAKLLVSRAQAQPAKKGQAILVPRAFSFTYKEEKKPWERVWGQAALGTGTKVVLYSLRPCKAAKWVRKGWKDINLIARPKCSQISFSSLIFAQSQFVSF